MSYKSEIFKEELDYINNNELKELSTRLVEMLPDYTFLIAASSTGKYHPDYCQGIGGLVRHTRAAVRIAQELLRLEMYSSINQYHDYIIIALLLHDGWKHGRVNEDGTYYSHTMQDHPKVCYDWLNELSHTDEFKKYENEIQYIAFLLLTHMGQWNLDHSSGEMFAPKPQTQEQMFVHLCDYLASRKCLEMNFNVKYFD